MKLNMVMSSVFCLLGLVACNSGGGASNNTKQDYEQASYLQDHLYQNYVVTLDSAKKQFVVEGYFTTNGYYNDKNAKVIDLGANAIVKANLIAENAAADDITGFKQLNLVKTAASNCSKNLKCYKASLSAEEFNDSRVLKSHLYLNLTSSPYYSGFTSAHLNLDFKGISLVDNGLKISTNGFVLTSADDSVKLLINQLNNPQTTYNLTPDMSSYIWMDHVEKISPEDEMALKNGATAQLQAITVTKDDPKKSSIRNLVEYNLITESAAIVKL